jgi:hypothetical protein
MDKAKSWGFYRDEWALEAYKIMNFALGNLPVILKPIPDMDVLSDMFSKNFDEGFIVINTDSEEERVFQEEKKKYGSVWQWHGSAIENYYSILRNGLMNLSNSHMMTAGAAHGAGIYTSNASQTSIGYCQSRGAGNY